MPAKTGISKVEAAERQLREAILLFFEERDAVSIHSLVGAAHELLRDLAVREGKGSLLKDYPYLRPERKAEWISIINAAKNFFKHADRDPDAVLDFNPETTRFLLYDAVSMYSAMTGGWFKEAFVYQIWFYGEYRRFLLSDDLRQFFDSFAKQLGGSFSCFEGILIALEKYELPEHLRAKNH